MSEAIPKLSSVEAHAANREETFSRVVMEYDQRKKRQGFEMGRPEADGNIRVSTVGMTGTQFEEYCLLASTQEKTRRHLLPSELPKITDDEQAISNALNQSFFAGETSEGSIYENRELYLSEWLHDLYHRICQVLRTRGTFAEAERKGVLMENIVKPVPCLQTSMDLHRGVDCLFVFHDPDAYREVQKKGFTNGKDQPDDPGVREAQYWNPSRDTIVTIDIAAYLGTKFGNAKSDKHDLLADVFASKTESAVNHAIRQRLQSGKGSPLPKREELKGGKFYWNRMEVLAERIVDTFEAKSGRMGTEKFPHLRNPEAEEQARIDAVHTDMKTKAASVMRLQGKKREEKAAGRMRGSETRLETGERTERNLESLSPHEKRIYEQRQAAKTALIHRAKHEGKAR